jgi:protein-L-isoaspartate(D-aspartate) O-methyltransferase
MAWRCSSFTNEGLVENLKRAGIIQSKRVVDAMKKTDRAKYVGPSDLVDPNVAYQDSPQPIGHRQTISAPHMVRAKVFL